MVFAFQVTYSVTEHLLLSTYANFCLFAFLLKSLSVLKVFKGTILFQFIGIKQWIRCTLLQDRKQMLKKKTLFRLKWWSISVCFRFAGYMLYFKNHAPLTKVQRKYISNAKIKLPYTIGNWYSLLCLHVCKEKGLNYTFWSVYGSHWYKAIILVKGWGGQIKLY